MLSSQILCILKVQNKNHVAWVKHPGVLQGSRFRPSALGNPGKSRKLPDWALFSVCPLYSWVKPPFLQFVLQLLLFSLAPQRQQHDSEGLRSSDGNRTLAREKAERRRTRTALTRRLSTETLLLQVAAGAPRTELGKGADSSRRACLSGAVTPPLPRGVSETFLCGAASRMLLRSSVLSCMVLITAPLSVLRLPCPCLWGGDGLNILVGVFEDVCC